MTLPLAVQPQVKVDMYPDLSGGNWSGVYFMGEQDEEVLIYIGETG